MQPFNVLVLNCCKWDISTFEIFLSSHCNVIYYFTVVKMSS